VYCNQSGTPVPIVNATFSPLVSNPAGTSLEGVFAYDYNVIDDPATNPCVGYSGFTLASPSGVLSFFGLSWDIGDEQNFTFDGSFICFSSVQYETMKLLDVDLIPILNVVVGGGLASLLIGWIINRH